MNDDLNQREAKMGLCVYMPKPFSINAVFATLLDCYDTHGPNVVRWTELTEGAVVDQEVINLDATDVVAFLRDAVIALDEKQRRPIDGALRAYKKS